MFGLLAEGEKIGLDVGFSAFLRKPDRLGNRAAFVIFNSRVFSRVGLRHRQKKQTDNDHK